MRARGPSMCCTKSWRKRPSSACARSAETASERATALPAICLLGSPRAACGVRDTMRASASEQCAEWIDAIKLYRSGMPGSVPLTKAPGNANMHPNPQVNHQSRLC